MSLTIPILFGSQTGNGIFLANQLEASLKQSFPSIQCFIMPLDSFNLKKINDFPIVVFICSTHGDAQAPFNMIKFNNFILSAKKIIFQFKSAVLGLGDSSYLKYNFCSRVLIEKLKILGSEVFLKDFSNSQDLNGMYDGFNRFKDGLIEYLKTFNSHNFINIPIFSDYFLQDSFFQAKVISNDEVTAENYSDKVFELCLSIPNLNNFKPGDCIALKPENTVELSKYFNFNKEQMQYLKEEIDFNSTVFQPQFVELSEFTNCQRHKDKMIEISQDYDLYHSYVIVPRRNILEIIVDFNLEIPFDFLKNYNKIFHRYFSFSSISNNSESIYKILYNIVEYSTYLKEKRLGLCSNYMKQLQQGQTIQIKTVNSNLYLKENNLLFFATGTGFTLPRSALHSLQNKRILIYYGFRYYKKDQLCLTELEKLKQENINFEIHYASSKDDKKYIMDLYRKNPVENIDDWLVFVSGNTRLNKEIKKLLREIHNKDVVFQSETW